MADTFFSRQNLGQQIRKIRKDALRLTQQELGEKLGVSKQTVMRWETGETFPDGDNILKIMSLLYPLLENAKCTRDEFCQKICDACASMSERQKEQVLSYVRWVKSESKKGRKG